MSSKSRRYSPHETYVRKVKKLQRAGLLGDIDLSAKPSRYVLGKLTQFEDVLSGRSAALRAPSQEQAAKLRGKFKFKGTGKTIIIPREKRETFSLTKSGDIVSTRPNPAHPSQKIKKTIGQGYRPRPEKGGKVYYTIPERQRGAGRIKRRTFSSFDEMLYYLEKYEVDFEQIEDYIEIEEFVEGSRRQTAIAKKISRERKAAQSRKKKKRKTTRKRR